MFLLCFSSFCFILAIQTLILLQLLLLLSLLLSVSYLITIAPSHDLFSLFLFSLLSSYYTDLDIITTASIAIIIAILIIIFLFNFLSVCSFFYSIHLSHLSSTLRTINRHNTAPLKKIILQELQNI